MEPLEVPAPDGVVPDPTDSPQAQLSKLFGSYRAEWLREHIYDFYASPVYFPELITGRSCMLEGGRGTGKTTALRAMSWQGQSRLSGTTPDNWPYFGIYYRVNTNRVTSLQGPELTSAEWMAMFGHYVNLLFCDRLMQFAEWFEGQVDLAGSSLLSAKSCSDLALAFGVEDEAKVTSIGALRACLSRSLIRFELYINNVVNQARPPISLQGQPIEILMSALLKHPMLEGKVFFLIVDEYENLLDDQQRILNTLIKHSNDTYSFKIGVRELGWRQRSTLNEHEQLRSPADFVRIDIDQKMQGVFQDFATQVCNDRLSRLQGPVTDNALLTVQELFPRLSEDEEALLLGIRRHTESLREELEMESEGGELGVFDELPELYKYLIGYWAKSQSTSSYEQYTHFLTHRGEWDTRYGNYKHALLYTLRRGRRGVHKYFAGYDTLTEVSGNNIRFFLQLVEHSLLAHLNDGKKLAEPVRPETQTDAAYNVGRLNLGELEGLSKYGMYLSRLVLALGRVFQVMAANPEGHTPEVNQFRVTEGGDNAARARRAKLAELPMTVDELLIHAVMHLALLRMPGTKPGDPGDTEEYDYMLHPVFAPLFEFSYRKKRRMVITKLQLAGLVQSPRSMIRDVLAGSKRSLDMETDLPDQLNLFSAFYDAQP